MKKKLYEYAVLVHPRDCDTCLDTELVVGPATMLAASEQEVTIKAHRAVPGDKLPEDLGRLEVLVRPFCGCCS
jgi:hypothetical protein